MRSILVLADRGPATEIRLQSALSLARLTGGHVSVMIDTPVTRYMTMDPQGGSYVATDALKQALAQDDTLGADFAARLEREDVPFDVQRSEDEPVDALCAAARLADVTVLSRSALLCGDVAMSSRTPVLVVRDDAPLQFPLARAVIAWDGGDEAALAMRSAVPLLQGCGQVQVLCVREKPGGFPATEALRYLSRHGIHADLVELPREGSIEETLAVNVAKAEADLLIMGAYGKSRMREFLFGGVTRYFLEESHQPALLLTH